MLRSSHPALELHLYGSGLAAEQTQAWGAQPGVRVVGWVPSTAGVYDNHRVFIAPLRCGAGLKGKVIAALARGFPRCSARLQPRARHSVMATRC